MIVEILAILSVIKIVVLTIFKLVRAIARKNPPKSKDEFEQNVGLADISIYKSILIAIALPIIFVCFLLILLNSFKGISQFINDFFNIDAYKYVDVLNLDLESNLNKIYIPEFVINVLGLSILCALLFYIYRLKIFNDNQ